MKLSLIHLTAFRRNWERLGLTDAGLQVIELMIAADPARPLVMRGNGGLRKVRFSPLGWPRGKSGGVRVCYAYFPRYGLAYLCAIYAKDEQANLTAAERNQYRSILEAFERYLRENWPKGWTP